MKKKTTKNKNTKHWKIFPCSRFWPTLIEIQYATVEANAVF